MLTLQLQGTEYAQRVKQIEGKEKKRKEKHTLNKHNKSFKYPANNAERRKIQKLQTNGFNQQIYVKMLLSNMVALGVP
jgi:hypothetical protein